MRHVASVDILLLAYCINFTDLFLYLSDYDSINVSKSMFWCIVLVDLFLF